MQKFYSQKTCWACYEIFAQFSPSAILPVRTGQNLSDQRFLYASFFLRPGKSRAIRKGGRACCISMRQGEPLFSRIRGSSQLRLSLSGRQFLFSEIPGRRTECEPRKLHRQQDSSSTAHRDIPFPDETRQRPPNFSVQLRKKHISRAYVAEYHLVRRMKSVNPVRIKLHVFSFRNRVPVEPRQPLKVIFSPCYFYFSCCLKGLLNEPISTRFPSGSAM